MNVAKAIIPNNKKLLPDGINEYVTPAISNPGKFTIGMHPEFITQRHLAKEPEIVQEDDSETSSNDSLDRSILQIQKLGVKEFAKRHKFQERDVKYLKDQFEQRFFDTSHKDKKKQFIADGHGQSKAQILKERIDLALQQSGKKLPSYDLKAFIKPVKKVPEGQIFKCVGRDHTAEQINESKFRQHAQEPKYNPNFSILERNPKMMLKWTAPEYKLDFHYANSAYFKSTVDGQLACEGSDKRQIALRKLYFDYTNEKTYKRGMRVLSVMNESTGPKKPANEASASKKQLGSSRMLEDQNSAIKRRSLLSEDGRLQDELDNQYLGASGDQLEGLRYAANYVSGQSSQKSFN